MSFFISQAEASTAGAQQGSTLSMFVMLGMFALIFFFMIYRPQAKRAKDHKNLMSSLSKGDEILTSGGLIGKISKITEGNDFVAIELNETNVITIKRDFITAVLPKGTLKSL